MSILLLPEAVVQERALKNRRGISVPRLCAYAGLCFGAGALALGVFTIACGGMLLNGYAKGKAERAFARAYPGCALRIGRLDYAIGANRLISQSLTLNTDGATLRAGRVTLTGVRWARLLWGTPILSDVLAHTTLEAANLDAEFPRARYAVRCARLRASVPLSELIAEGAELRTLVADEEFFAAHDFRTTRFHVIVPECRVEGLAYGELLQGKAYRARSVRFSRPSFDALVNRDRAAEPFTQRPLMVPEALAAIRQPVQIDSLSVTNGSVRYSERLVAGAYPGVLTFAEVNISAEGIANRGEAAAAILLRAQGEFMNAATLKVLMAIPITPPDLSFHYSGSLSAMDLTSLDAFLDIAEHTRVKSGSVQEAAFDIDVTAGKARGHVRAIYRNLEIAVLDKHTGDEKGVENRIVSFLANQLKIRKSNAPDALGAMKEGEINYDRKPTDEFMQFAWFALRSGVLDAISQ